MGRPGDAGPASRLLVVRPARSRLLVVLTVRSDELHRAHPFRRMAARWEQQRLVERLELERLDAPAVAPLRSRRSSASAPTASSSSSWSNVRRGSRCSSRSCSAPCATAAIEHDYLPPSLRDVLLARAENLSPQRPARPARGLGGGPDGCPNACWRSWRGSLRRELYAAAA